MADVQIGTQRGVMTAHLARPVDEGPWPGVVVVHDAAIAHQDVRTHALRLAGDGYLVLALDASCAEDTFACVDDVHPPAIPIDAARAWLASHPRSTGVIGVLRFGKDGRFALTLASRDRAATSHRGASVLRRPRRYCARPA